MGKSRLLLYSIPLHCFLFLYSSEYDVLNNTDMPLSITWKSHGIGFTSKQGNFILSAGAMCKGCISTYSNNCVHILFIESLDKKYRLRSKPFCKSSRIAIYLENSKRWFKKDKKELRVIVDPFPDNRVST